MHLKSSNSWIGKTHCSHQLFHKSQLSLLLSECVPGIAKPWWSFKNPVLYLTSNSGQQLSFKLMSALDINPPHVSKILLRLGETLSLVSHHSAQLSHTIVFNLDALLSLRFFRASTCTLTISSLGTVRPQPRAQGTGFFGLCSHSLRCIARMSSLTTTSQPNSSLSHL